ncbi:xylulokinase [Polycladidibacter stylochi]|uniref:xylulokinase n=1 Tax=Polycladidibacter stylochi TaxID=1807766 RepID=UPI000830CBFD|nr:FGGY family carbohydrate kinase [Pseudovibrio stylochi]
MGEVLIGIDIGTTGVKVAMFDTAGELVASSYQPHDTSYPAPDHVEQRPQDWIDGTLEGLRKVLAQSAIDPKCVAGISFSGQMMGQIPIDCNGNLLEESVPIWADQRAKAEAARFLEDFGGHEAYYDITYQGHPVHMTSIFRMMWYAKNKPEVFARAVKWLHAKEYVLYFLTGAMATEPTDQCLGGAFDLKAGKHSAQILSCANLSADLFPDMVESTDVAGKISPKIAELTGLQAGTPVSVGAGDGPCAAAGSAAIAEGDAYFYLGSALWGGTIESQPFGDFSSRMICYRHLIPGLYHSQYVSFTGAIGQQWFVENSYSELEGADAYERALAEVAAIGDEATPMFLPFLRPGGAPHQHGNASGVFYGLRNEHKRAHLYKSVVMGIAHSLQVLYDDVTRVTGRKIDELTIIGGGARNPLLMQSVSSGLGIPVQLLADQEANCLAAALCAGVGVGIWPNASAAKESGIFQRTARYQPDPAKKEELALAQAKFRTSIEIAKQLWSLEPN